MDETDVDELSNETNEVSENQNDNNSDVSELDLGHDENGANQFEQDAGSNVYVTRGTCTNSSSGGEIAREETQAEISSLDYLRAGLENSFAPTNLTSEVVALALNADEVREEFGIVPEERPAQEQSSSANIFNDSKFVDPQTIDLANRLKALLVENEPMHEEYDIESKQISASSKETENLISKAEGMEPLYISPSLPSSDSFPINDRHEEFGSEAPSPTSFAVSASSDSQGGFRSSASSHSLHRSYLYNGLASEDSQFVKDHLKDCRDEQNLIPRYKTDNKGYCWPTEILPLGGNNHFDEGKQWNTATKDSIGEGASGNCYIATTIDTERPTNDSLIFCVKKLTPLKYNREEVVALYLSGKDLYEAEHVRTSVSSNSENIVYFYGATLCKTNACIFMKLMEGTVDDYIKKLKKVDESLSKDDYLTYLRDVLSALNFLHGKGILHNDVKAANVLLDTAGLSAKLADFGNATPMDNDPQPRKQDIWSACCFLLEMLDDWCQTPHFAVPDDVKNLQPHNDNDTNDILNLFRNNDNKILTKLSDILPNKLRTTNVH